MKNLSNLALTLFFAAMAQAQPVQTWGRYLDISVNTTTSGGGARVADSVVNFPLLVRLNTTNAAAVLSEALTGGADVRFADSSGNSIPYGIEQWSSTDAAVWVRVPRIRGNAITRLRLYWGKAGAVSASRDSSVFNASNGYEAVFHLNENTGDTARDASSSGFKGIPVGTPPVNVTGANAVIGNAKNFGGNLSTTNLTQGGAYRLETRTGGNTYNSFDYTGLDAAFTMSAWIRVAALPAPNAFGRRRGIVTKANAAGGDANDPSPLQWCMRPNASDRVLNFQRISVPNGGTAPYSVRPDSIINRWTYVTYIANGAGVDDNLFRAYNELDRDTTILGDEDGLHGDVDAFIGGFASADGASGQKSAGQQYFNGQIDEVRISRVSRTAAWADLEFETQRPNVTAVTYGAAQNNDTSRVFLYPLRTATYLIGQAVSLAPYVKAGSVTGASISPALPGGLSINSAGVISGTPGAVSGNLQYIVTATIGANTYKDTLMLAVSAGDPPGKPASPVAVYGANATTATLTWTAPSVTGSSAITGYQAVAIQDTVKSCTTTTALTCVISGLNGATSYSFEVRAINNAGPGPFSSASNLLVPPTVPGASLAITAVLGVSGTVTIYWNAAPSGGSPITGYKVTAVSDTTKACTWTTGELLCVVSGLTVGQSYSFVVRATNAIGTGPASSASSPVTIPTGIRPFVLRVSGAAKPFTYTLPREALAGTDKLTMSISDVWGRTVWSRSVNPKKDGRELTWNGKASNGRAVAAGTYIVRVSVVSGGKTLESIRKEIAIKPL